MISFYSRSWKGQVSAFVVLMPFKWKRIINIWRYKGFIWFWFFVVCVQLS